MSRTLRILMALGLFVGIGSPKGLSGDYFALVGDADAFIATVDGWLAGVAQDPEYLRHMFVAPWAKSFVWSQNIEDEGFTQPRGWTGFAQALVTPREQAYNGYVILADFQPTRPTTPLHEAIHAYAFAVGAGDLDNDAYGGPEFLSGGLRSILGDLRNRDAALCGIIDGLLGGQAQEAEIARLTQALVSRQRAAQTDVNGGVRAPQIGELLALLGGREDWAGYRQRVDEVIDLARAGDEEARSAGRCTDDDGAVWVGVLDPARLLSRPATASDSEVRVQLHGDGVVSVVLEIAIESAYSDPGPRVGCMRGGGTATAGPIDSEGRFQATVPTSIGARNVVAGTEDPCQTMSQPDEPYPLSLSGQLDQEAGTGTVTLGWLTGPIEVAVTRQ